jgi:hypothetical protein
MRLLAPLTVLLALQPLPIFAQQDQSEDPRSRVVLDQTCENDFSRRQVTLFANGTLRRLVGEGATREMRLAELGPAEYEAFMARLGHLRFDDLAHRSAGMGGDWVESCRLELALPHREKKTFEYGPYDTVSPGLRQILLIFDDLMLEIARVGPDAPRVRGFEVEVRDRVIRRRDGARFEVIGFTLEGNGIELQGLDQPVTIFVVKSEIQLEFDLLTGNERR